SGRGLKRGLTRPLRGPPSPGGRGLQNPGDIDVLFQELTDSLDTQASHILTSCKKAQMPLWDFNRGVGRQPTQNWRVPDSVCQNAVVTFTCNAIEDNASNLKAGIEQPKSLDQRRGTTRHRMSVDNEDDGEPQPCRHLSRASFFRLAIETV